MAVYAGAPSVAHTEALLRATLFRATELAEPLDAIVIGIPSTTPFMPRERPNPVSAAYLGLGLALRHVAERAAAPPGRDGDPRAPASAPLPAPTQTPVPRAVLRAAHRARPRLAACGRRGGGRRHAGGRGLPRRPHLPPAAAVRRVERCDVATERLGAVLVAGCRDAHAARQLGFVPAAQPGAALEMARGRGATRIGWLLSPPYFPLVGSEL